MNNLAEQQDIENESPKTQDVVVENSDSNFEVEVIEDTPEEEKPRLAEDREPEVPSDDEIDKYSAGVQKRINKLKFEAQEQERQKLEAHKLQEEALRYAQQVKTENEKLKQTLDQGEATLIDQAKGRITAELDKAKTAYKAAYESGDPDALLAAQEQLSAMQNEQYRVNTYKPQSRVQAEPTPQPQYAQQTPQVPRPDDRALNWAKNNKWFETDSEMTGYAYGLHEKLVKSGIDPRTEQYYNEIDSAVRRVFPDRFDDGQVEEPAPQRQNGSVVAAPSKSTKKPRTVRLSSTQASLAKRLGLSNEQYAAQLLKEMSK
tara:strand:- start:4800 stop:5750 length:951 start_codon:yes stop_codon:yes gene_type:complete